MSCIDRMRTTGNCRRRNLPDKNQYCPLDTQVCMDDDRLEFVDGEKAKAEAQQILKDQKQKESGVAK